VSEIKQAGGRAVFIAADVRSSAQVEALYAGAREAFGKVNGLGAVGPARERGPR